MSSLWETLGNGPEEDDLVHEAALDYPVLAEILTERPPLPASTRVAIRRTASTDSDPSISGNMSALVEDQLDDSLSVEAKGWLKMVKDVAFPGEVDPDDWKHSPSFDYCRFRRDTRCYFPKELDQEHTKVAGYTVWRVVDRGPCPRIKWDAQRECRVSEPGPNSKHPDALIECTRNWEDGGQRDGHVRRRG